ncbi:hypothetical protein IMG5_007840 [Ichthyophthirius multifiliis]|uniref:Uncharacterized protein n=1 Tax=Ichthyophthirius multifiliis TaxID=5932 RepID=G0QJR5_ICHMU|nr:hypothetical protein IMG5_007840 [Ichthyophthirius multifiliis]EGR34547.1 hypothetical protein IMG5_007840 [Ichthyophthirius multifiliis]|eukprot:XP_004039851.1 hypothetical protein IMG5_007840 [Ichthyophthirius multifiliis]
MLSDYFSCISHIYGHIHNLKYGITHCFDLVFDRKVIYVNQRNSYIKSSICIFQCLNILRFYCRQRLILTVFSQFYQNFSFQILCTFFRNIRHIEIKVQIIDNEIFIINLFSKTIRLYYYCSYLFIQLQFTLRNFLSFLFVKFQAFKFFGKFRLYKTFHTITKSLPFHK